MRRKIPGPQSLAEVFFCHILQQKAGSVATTSCKGVWNGMVVCSEKAGQGALGSIVTHTCAFEQKPMNGGEPGTAEQRALQLCVCVIRA